MTALIIFFSILFCTVGFAAYSYFKLSRLHESLKSAWASLDVALRFRREIVKNFVSLTEKHSIETEELVKVINALNTDLDPEVMPNQRSKEEVEISHNLRSFFILTDINLSLTTNENFVLYKKSLAKAEIKIKQTVSGYNNAVRDFNTMLSIFPVSIVGKMFDFERYDFFIFEETDPGAGHQAQI
ncbi:LemA protein [Elusimicrobium simillimum]|uniref:LemA family protein n=1 Tax=Elusimicrobium simillimum TaxID=3143438 RepID=UPI003C6FA2DF